MNVLVIFLIAISFIKPTKIYIYFPSKDPYLFKKNQIIKLKCQKIIIGSSTLLHLLDMQWQDIIYSTDHWYYRYYHATKWYKCTNCKDCTNVQRQTIKNCRSRRWGSSLFRTQTQNSGPLLSLFITLSVSSIIQYTGWYQNVY